jgi:hypothetical protein
LFDLRVRYLIFSLHTVFTESRVFQHLTNRRLRMHHPYLYYQRQIFIPLIDTQQDCLRWQLRRPKAPC